MKSSGRRTLTTSNSAMIQKIAAPTHQAFTHQGSQSHSDHRNGGRDTRLGYCGSELPITFSSALYHWHSASRSSFAANIAEIPDQMACTANKLPLK